MPVPFFNNQDLILPYQVLEYKYEMLRLELIVNSLHASSEFDLLTSEAEPSIFSLSAEFLVNSQQFFAMHAFCVDINAVRTIPEGCAP